MAWLRVDADLDWHPQIREVGFWGSVAFQLVLRACKQFGAGDTVQGAAVTPFALAERAGRGCTPERIGEGLEAAIRAGLLERTTDGNVRVTGWGRYNKSPSDLPDRVAERVRAWRERNAAESSVKRACNDPVTGVTDVTTDVRDGTGRTGRDGDGSDLPPTPAPPPPPGADRAVH